MPFERVSDPVTLPQRDCHLREATPKSSCRNGNLGGVEEMPRSAYAMAMARRVRQGTLAQVGRHLRMLRIANGHSQVQWADALQITPQLLNKWEKGTRQPNIDVLIRICESFRCSMDFIFRGRLGHDVDPELREKLSSLFPGSFVLQVAPAEPPQSPDPSAAATSVTRKPRKKSPRSRSSAVRISARRKPPSPPGGSRK